MWTMFQQKDSFKWQLIFTNNDSIFETGYLCDDLSTMSKFVAYMNHGIKNDIPQHIRDDLDCMKERLN